MADAESNPTVGRHDELDQIGALITTLRSGAAGVLLVRGEAGIGKSHLCRVAVALAARAGINAAVATSDELEQDRPGRLLLALGAALVPEEPDALVPSEPHTAADGDAGYRTIERFLTAVEQATAAGPVLLVVEDLHWADELSLRALATLVRSIDQLPCAVLATMRNHPRPKRLVDIEVAVDRLHRRAQVRIVELGGLAPRFVEELASRQLGAPPGTTLRSFLTGAAGNPFIIEELIRSAAREDLLRIVDGMAEVPVGSAPATLQDALVQRLRTVTPATAAALRHASLLGRTFTATELATVTAQAVIEVFRLIEEAVDTGIVLAADREYEFRHDLVRDAVYRTVPPAARWDLHRAAGAALAASGAPALRVAQQFAAGARPGDVEAVEWMRRAASDALVFDTASAAHLLERALSVAPPDWVERFDVEADLIELLAWAGRIDEALRRGQALVARAVAPAHRFRAHQALGTVRSSVGDLVGAAEQFRAASETGAANEATAEQLRCAAAGMSVIAGQLTANEARAVASPLLADERADVVCWARNTLAVAAVSEGAYDEVIEHAGVAASILDDQHVRPLGFLIPHAWVMTGLQYLDRYDDSSDAGQRARRRAERRGDVGLLVQVMAGTCGLTWARADWDETAAEIDAAFALMADTGVVTHAIFFHALAALIAAERGRPQEAASHLEAAEAFASSGTLHLFGLDILAGVQSRRMVAGSDPEAACDLLNGVWDVTAALRGLIQWRLIGPELVELCIATGREGRAAAVADEIRILASRSTAPSAAATVQRVDGLARRDARLLMGAADAFLATPRRIEAAQACEDAVRVLLATDGTQSDAERLLEAAEEVYARADAVVGVDRVRALRRGAGLGSRGAGPRPRFGWDALTAKELEVVRLVSRGLSNPEIAAELFISRRTVEAHLSHVFQKLDVANRTQLAREAIARDLV